MQVSRRQRLDVLWVSLGMEWTAEGWDVEALVMMRWWRVRCRGYSVGRLRGSALGRISMRERSFLGCGRRGCLVLIGELVEVVGGVGWGRCLGFVYDEFLVGRCLVWACLRVWGVWIMWRRGLWF